MSSSVKPAGVSPPKDMSTFDVILAQSICVVCTGTTIIVGTKYCFFIVLNLFYLIITFLPLTMFRPFCGALIRCPFRL